jgi:hypothetical protein
VRRKPSYPQLHQQPERYRKDSATPQTLESSSASTPGLAVQQPWNLTPIFLIGKSLPGSLTPWIEAAARRIRSRRQSGFKGIVRPDAGKKGRGKESPELGGLFSSPFFLIVSLNYGKILHPAWRKRKLREISTPTHAILPLPGKSKLLSKIGKRVGRPRLLRLLFSCANPLRTLE